MWVSPLAFKRITPACAGSTKAFERKYLNEEDHPRLRGEYIYVDDVHYYTLGSPPLARGVLEQIQVIAQGTRITPACAGSTLSPLLPVP